MAEPPSALIVAECGGTARGAPGRPGPRRAHRAAARRAERPARTSPRSDSIDAPSGKTRSPGATLGALRDRDARPDDGARSIRAPAPIRARGPTIASATTRRSPTWRRSCTTAPSSCARVLDRPSSATELPAPTRLPPRSTAPAATWHGASQAAAGETVAASSIQRAPGTAGQLRADAAREQVVVRRDVALRRADVRPVPRLRQRVQARADQGRGRSRARSRPRGPPRSRSSTDGSST